MPSRLPIGTMISHEHTYAHKHAPIHAVGKHILLWDAQKVGYGHDDLTKSSTN